MTEFSFAFSYDRSRRVAWLALDGYLDEVGMLEPIRDLAAAPSTSE
jgi:hypothetical protein